MVARLVRDQEVVGSSPVTSTTKKRRVFCPSLFCFCGREPATSSLLQGSRKSQRSEIFGKRRSGARTRAPPCRGGARKQPTATTRVQVPSPRPRKSEGFCPSLFCITNALAGGKGAMKQKSKKTLTFSVAALPKRRGQERQQECRGRDLSAYR